MPTITPGSQVTQLNNTGIIARALGRLFGGQQQIPLWMSAWFSPGSPQMVMAPQTPEAGTLGRKFNYPVGYNLIVTPRANEPVSFSDLRFLADNCDLLRMVIESRKDQLEKLEWQVIPHKDSKTAPDDPRIKAAEKFLKNPCTEGNWQYWLRAIVEDMLVVDGICLYKRKTMGGELFSLDIMQPDTIKLLIDETGRRPQPPYPAYQQIIWGVPASDYIAVGGEVDEEGNGSVPFTTHELIYRIRNPRSGKIYGFSPVEQIILTVNIVMRRQLQQLAYFTAGNIPDMLVQMPESWTPEMIQNFQEWFDEMLSGNLSNRRRAKMVPGGSKPIETSTAPQKDPEFDEWLARLICYTFSISPQAFVKMMNRATGETAKDTAEEEGLQPLKLYLKAMLDEVIAAEWGDDLQFAWKEAPADMEKLATAMSTLTDSGMMTIDEGRRMRGQDPMGGMASRLTVKTATGLVPVTTDVDDKGDKVQLTTQELAAEAGSQALLDNGGVEPAAKPEEGERKEEDGMGSKKDEEIEPTEKGARRTDTGLAKKHPVPGLGFMADGHNVNAVAALTPTLTSALTEAGKGVAAEFRKLAKADDDEAERLKKLIDDMDLAAFFTAVGDAVSAEDISLFRVAGTNSLLAVGTSFDSGLFNQIDAASLEFASTRGAELVTEISETTRGWLRDLIVAGLEESKGAAAIADDIEASRSFSAARAKLIAETEVGNANGAGALRGLEIAEAAGVVLKKEWLVADLPCPICEANAAAGAIPVGQAFPSGDQYPLAHPRCRCTVVGVVG